VYLIFALILVGVAFMNIFGIGGDAYAIKKMIPRFFVGLLIVPMSWYIVSFTVSVTSVLSASVLMLPADLVKTTGEPIQIPNNCTVDFAATGSGMMVCAKGQGGQLTTTDYTIAELLSSSMGGYGILHYYAYKLYNFDALKDIKWDNIKSITDLTSLALHQLIGVVIFGAFLLLMLALIFALFSRAIMLWILAIFSPLFGLMHLTG
jgi:hypothetical protein